MNIIIEGFHKYPISRFLPLLTGSFDINNAVIIYKGNEEIVDSLKTNNLMKNLHTRAKHTKYPLDLNTLPPVGEKLITEMSNCETVVLKMMELVMKKL